MQDRESQSDVNPGIVEQRLDRAPVERDGLQGSSGVEREGMQVGGVEREGTQAGDVEREEMRGAPVVERERSDDGPDARRGEGDTGHSGRENALH